MRDAVPSQLVEPVMAVVPDRTFMKKETRDIWFALTGTKINRADVWRSYQAQVQHRNRTLHRGEDVTEQAAKESARVATELLGYMHDAVRDRIAVWAERA